MALKPCNGCGKEVDETARSCPNCGRPNPAKSNAAKGRAGAIATVLVVLFAIGGFQIFRSFGKKSSQGPSESTAVVPSAGMETLKSARVHFEGDQLDECVDLDFRMTAPATPPANWHEIAHKILAFTLNQSAEKAGKPGAKKTIDLQKSCAEQFSDRKPFATCTMTRRIEVDQGTIDMEGRSHRYLFETVFLSDAAMKECLGVGAKWDSMSRDSDEFRMAQLQDSTTKARKLLGKALRDDESAR
jgi:hypothetical protein